MANLRFFSADSHLMEPGDLWEKRLDRKFRDTSPRVIPNPRGGFLFTAPEISPFPVSAGFGAGHSPDEMLEFRKKGYEACRPSGWDPVERLKDQDIDGVLGEVLYPTLGMPLFQLQDAELQLACFKVFNDFSAEFCSHNRQRLIGAALIPLADVNEGVKELQRAAKIGLRGAMISGSPVIPYYDNRYDPFWEAASEVGLPLSLHVITGSTRASTGAMSGMGEAAARAVGAEFYMSMVFEVQRSIVHLVSGRVLERFPQLRFVSAENDVGWIPHFMFRMDHAYEKLTPPTERAIPNLPSEYIKRQIFATFLEDPVAPVAVKLFGEDNYLWGSDFPHTDSTWPKSRQTIERVFAGVDPDITDKILYRNAARVYGLEL